MCLRNLGKIKIKIPEDSLILIQQKETIYIYIFKFTHFSVTFLECREQNMIF